MARTMKDSGIPWVGKVPSDWEVTRLKFIITANDGGVWGDEPNGDDGTIVLRSTEQTLDGKIKITEPARRRLSSTERTKALLKEGDLIITKSSGSEDHIGKTSLITREVAALKCCYSNFLQRIRVIDDTRFIWHMMNSVVTKEQFVQMYTTSTGLKNLNAEKIRSVVFARPPLPEQKRIAEYLDKVTESIDGLRAKIEREIERLGDWRKSVITESVCHGLDKNVAMKDSGIPWVGKVPSAWEVNKIKYWFAATNSRGNSILQLLSATQKYGMYPQSKLEGVVQVAEKTDLNSFKTVHIDDFVISLRSFQGGIERSDYEGVCSPAYQTFHATRTIDTAYFKHLFKSQGFIAALNLLTVGIREGKTINYSDVRNMLIPVPPLPEQKRIAEHLDKVTAKIDEMIGKRKAELERLESLKRSIVCECVTGKRVVSG